MINKADHITRKIFGSFFWVGVASEAGLAISNIADSLVVGTTMGAKGLAAIGIILPVFMLINVLAAGLAIGGSIRYSALLAGGRAKEAVIHFNSILLCALVISSILAVLGNLFMPQVLYVLGAKDTAGELYQLAEPYARILFSFMPLFFVNIIFYDFLRNDGRQKIAAVGYIVNCICDFFLNFLFVIVLDFGIAGAIWSTIIAQLIAVLIYLPQFFLRWGILRIRLNIVKIKEALISFKNGLSSSVQYAFQFISIMVMNQILLNLAGEIGVAVFDIVQNVSYIAFIFFSAATGAVLPMVSTFAEERDVRSVRGAVKRSLWYGVVMGTLWAVLIIVFAPAICILFGLNNTSHISFGVDAIRLFALCIPFAGISLIGTAYMQALEKPKLSFLLVSLRCFFILLPAAWLFSFTNVHLFFWVFAVTEIASLCIALSIIRKKKPLNSVIYNDDKILSKDIRNGETDLGIFFEEIERFCEDNEATPQQSYLVTMTVEETVTIILSHAFDSNDGYVHLTLFKNGEGDFELHMRDNAKKFDPFSLKTGRLKDVEDDTLQDSMGILMVKKKAKSFFYRSYQGFNSLVVKI